MPMILHVDLAFVQAVRETFLERGDGFVYILRRAFLQENNERVRRGGWIEGF